MSSLPSERIVLARTATPDGDIQLQQRPLAAGSHVFEIISDGVFLMASYNQVSERALARHALAVGPSVGAASPCRAGPLRVLVAGLGMGFTLQEVLSTPAALPGRRDAPLASVDVVEISPYIIAWNRTYFAPLNGDVLADPRVRLIQDDVYNLLLRPPQAAYHAILLDVDNGPSWLAHADNARLYTLAALERWSRLLAPGGCLAVWAAQPEPEFLERTRVVFGQAEDISILAPDHANQPVEHFIYCARRG